MNITVKDLPPNLHRKLKTQATANKRSLNMEIISVLESSLQSRKLDVEALLAQIKAVRDPSPGRLLTDAQIRAVKNQGRS
ncbi:MAG: Arc family DNA-binding protein [Verrucomicrobiota bacterium]